MIEFTKSAAGRDLHLIDGENLLGGTRFSVTEVAGLKARYTALTSARTSSHVVLAASAQEPALQLGVGWGGGCRLLLRRGHDGADLALLDVIRTERIANRFRKVFVGSGDGIFAAAVSELAGSGVDVTVVSRRRSLATALRLAAPRVIYLDPSQVAIDVQPDLFSGEEAA